MVKGKDKDTIDISDHKDFSCKVNMETRTIECEVKNMDAFKKVTGVAPKKIEFTLNEDAE